MKYIQDPNLSFRSKGIMAFIEQQFDAKEGPVDFSFKMLESSEGRDAKRKALNDLIREGYIEQVTKRNESGHIIGTTFHVKYHKGE